MSDPDDLPVTGIVLAGGRSRRFGRDKLAEPYGDAILLHRPVLTLRELCDEVVVVLAPGSPEPPMPEGADVVFARDTEQDAGPLAGLVAGLTAAREGWAVVVGGDMPDLQRPVLLEMLRAGHETGAVAVALSDGGDARPLPSVLHVGPALVAAERLMATDRRRLRDLLAEVHTVVIDEPTWTALDPERRTLLDVDEPSDLEAGRESRPVPHSSFTIGGHEVTPLCDGWAPLPLTDEMPGIDVDWDAERRRHPWAFPEDDATSWAWHVHAFLIRGPEHVVLVDTGIGHFGRSPFDVEGRLDEELASRGVAPEDVDDVVLTHLHADHSGAVCRPDGTPRFPRARHHVHPWDWEFFAEHRTPEDFTGRFAMAAIEEAGLLDLDPSDHTTLSDASVSVRHAPGHTPGHRVVLLDDGDAVLLLTGDLLHTTPQIAHPTNRSNHDEDPVLAAGERLMLLLQASRSGWTVGVSHFGRPFGRVVGEEDTFDWSPI